MNSLGFKLFNPMNWLILKPSTIRDTFICDNQSIDSDEFFDKDSTRPKKRIRPTKKTYRAKKFKDNRFNKTKRQKRK